MDGLLVYKKERDGQSRGKRRESFVCFGWFMNRVLFMVEEEEVLFFVVVMLLA